MAGPSNLTDDQIEEIRSRWLRGEAASSLHREFKCHTRLIDKIIAPVRDQRVSPVAIEAKRVKDEILRMRHEGSSLGEIMKAVNRSKGYVHKICGSKNTREEVERWREQAKALKAAGLRQEEIAKTVGKGVREVQRVFSGNVAERTQKPQGMTREERKNSLVARDKEIVEQRKIGRSAVDIGKEFRVGPERVRRICAWAGFPFVEMMQAKKEKREKEKEVRRAAYVMTEAERALAKKKRSERRALAARVKRAEIAASKPPVVRRPSQVSAMKGFVTPSKGNAKPFKLQHGTDMDAIPKLSPKAQRLKDLLVSDRNSTRSRAPITLPKLSFLEGSA